MNITNVLLKGNKGAEIKILGISGVHPKYILNRQNRFFWLMTRKLLATDFKAASYRRVHVLCNAKTPVCLPEALVDFVVDFIRFPHNLITADFNQEKCIKRRRERVITNATYCSAQYTINDYKS